MSPNTEETDHVRDGGYDEFLDALEAGDGYYLESSDGRGWLPPRRVDPRTGDANLTEKPLPDTGTIVTKTVIRVPTPQFDGDAPFALAIADFGPVKMTGHVRGTDPEEVDQGMQVQPTVETRETTDDRMIVFRPIE